MQNHKTHKSRLRLVATIKGACAVITAMLLASLVLLSGCVNQHPDRSTDGAAIQSTGVPTGLTGDDAENPRIIATSIVIVQIAEKLDLNLLGTPQSSIAETPERYSDTVKVGPPMQPDLEIIKSIKPDIILSPTTLEADLQQQYQAAELNSLFVDLRSIDGMYSSIQELGVLFDRQAEAQALLDQYHSFMEAYQSQTASANPPRVLILMGLPGSYVVATENSYVGSLLKMAGGINVYAGEIEEFITANTEDMVARDPDIILRTAHALPVQVMEMFAEEFNSNDIWRHFGAVKEGRVYDLPSTQFGMSANFEYPEALEHLRALFEGVAR